MKIESMLKGLITLTLCTSLSTLAADNKPKNIVLMIGDGMGPAYTTGYRLYKDDPKTPEVETTIFDRLLVGGSRTTPAPVSGYVTDSAAAATAMSTGIKTYNGAIGLDEHKQTIETLLEKAKAEGKAIGIAVTSEVNHATPASFLAHNESRRNLVEIAEDYLDSNADVILGGGQKYFSDELIGKFEQKGYQYVEDMAALEKIESGKVLALLAEKNLPWVLDNPAGHQLNRITDKALSLLSQYKNGFVLLVEGSAIDWAGHRNDIATAMGEMEEFAKSIEVVERFVENNPDTLMVVTADHETGGMSLGSNDKKAWYPEVLRNIQGSPEGILTSLIGKKNWKALLAEKLGFEPTQEEWDALNLAKGTGPKELYDALLALIDMRSNTGWTSHQHSAVDVQVFAKGKGYEHFIGSQENTDIARKLMEFLK